jgi:pimeloyl-ACP methyl ester carboxylesterase
MHVTGILSEKHKVFMMDQRGHGYSGHASGQYGREDHVRDVVFVLENVINQPAII